jgi:hypothetical protein
MSFLIGTMGLRFLCHCSQLRLSIWATAIVHGHLEKTWTAKAGTIASNGSRFLWSFYEFLRGTPWSPGVKLALRGELCPLGMMLSPRGSFTPVRPFILLKLRECSPLVQSLLLGANFTPGGKLML